MQNLTFQSENVKQYFVHALKSLGLRHNTGVRSGNLISFPEMKEAEILQFLENPQTTSSDLRDAIKLAIMQQYQNDASNQDFIKQKTVIGRQTVRKILTGLGVDDSKCNNLLRSLTTAGVDQHGNIPSIQQGAGFVANTNALMDGVVDTVITAMLKGVNEQKLDSEAKQEAKNLWTDTLYAEFEQVCASQPNFDQNAFNTWKQDQNNQQLNEEYECLLFARKDKQIRAWANAYLGSDSICNVKVDKIILQQIRANHNLLKESLAYCEKRCAVTMQSWNDKNLEDMLTVGDILAVAGDEKMQIAAFCQTRSEEQKNQAVQDPARYESKTENKIDHVLGVQGQKHIKAQTIPGSVIESETVKKLKAGKKGPWRGLQPLYNKIDKIVSRIFKPVQAIGFSQAYIKRETGYSFASNDKNNHSQTIDKETDQELKDPVHTDYAKDEAQLNSIVDVARKFYAKTKARVLNDKMSIASFTVFLHSGNTERAEFYKDYIDYLKVRVGRGEDVLANKIPDPQSPDYQNQAYYDKLEEYILAEAENQNNLSIINQIKADKTKQANELVADSIYMFNEVAKDSVVGEKETTKRQMAQQFFHVESYVQAGTLTEQDLDQMTERFFSKADGVGKMCYDLCFPNGNDIDVMAIAAMNAVDKFTEFNKFVVKDLQENALKTQYEQYKETKDAVDDRRAVEQNRAEIRQAAAEEMGMGL